MRIDCHSDTALWLKKIDSLLDIQEAHQDYHRIVNYLDLAFFNIFLDEKKYSTTLIRQYRKIFNRLLNDILRCHQWVVPLLWQDQLKNPNTEKVLPKLILIGVEGAGGLGHEFEFLDKYFELGLRLIGPTWNYANPYAGGCMSDTGFSKVGYDLIKKCNIRGILLDGAHLNKRSFWDLLEASEVPIIVSHTCCATINPNPRNLDDLQMKALADNNGVLGITFVKDFLGGTGDLNRLCEHIEYAVSLIDSCHVALGSDFDGSDPCQGIAGVQSLPVLFSKLKKRGMNKSDIENIAGLSAKKLLAKVLPKLIKKTC